MTPTQQSANKQSAPRSAKPATQSGSKPQNQSNRVFTQRRGTKPGPHHQSREIGSDTPTNGRKRTYNNKPSRNNFRDQRLTLRGSAAKVSTVGNGLRTPHDKDEPGHTITIKEATKSGTTSSHTISRDKLRIIPLGGLEEVGANMMAYEYGDDIIIVDMGFAFPDETTPGIDYIIPETRYLEEKKANIRGIFITHGHMDHIGAIPYLLAKLGDPAIYTMRLSAGMIKKRLEEFNLDNRAKINSVGKDDVIVVGNFKIRFFAVNHNIPDSVGLCIGTPVGQVIHTGDWKIDHTPINERPTEFNKLAQFGNEGVIALCSDSTNALKPGYCTSEREIGKTIDKIFQESPGRIIFASFSSLIPRMQQVFDLCAKHNRKILVTGRSMVNTIEVGLSLGYLQVTPKLFVKAEQTKNLPDNQVLILTTGAQGEESSSLARMARGEHRLVKLKMGDTAIISASPIPGNERSVVSLLDNLTREGVNVVYNKILDIHTSGHAQQEELKLMMQLVKPKYFIPIHGEHHMLAAHGKIAQSINIPANNIFVMDNGAILEIDQKQEAKLLTEKVASGYVFVDGLGVGDVGEVVLRDRQVMAQDGMFVVIVTLDRRNGRLTSQPDILSRGFIYMKNNDEILREVKHEVRKVVESQNKNNNEPNWADLRNAVRDAVGEFLFQKTERRPMVLPVVIEV